MKNIPDATDLFFMRRALALAKQGEYTAHPNPRVGCLLVQNNKVIGEGVHWETGGLHAECHALAHAQEKARGATCYVTLEPCAHVGRTGPCVDALILAGVQRIVIATEDPNPLVQGKGIKALKESGIEIKIGVLADEAKALNKGFFSRMLRGRPYIRAKIAMSLDGRIAMASGESQWITELAAREDAHAFRARSGAILTTYQTVMKDNSRLTVRYLPAEQIYKPPVRIVLDTHLQLSPDAAIFKQEGTTIVALSTDVCAVHEAKWFSKVANKDVECLRLPLVSGHMDLRVLLDWLAKGEINDLLIEAGGYYTGALVQQGLIDELLIYLAPIFLGHEAKAVMQLPGIQKLSEQIRGCCTDIQRVGNDVRLVVALSDFARLNYGNS